MKQGYAINRTRRSNALHSRVGQHKLLGHRQHGLARCSPTHGQQEQATVSQSNGGGPMQHTTGTDEQGNGSLKPSLQPESSRFRRFLSDTFGSNTPPTEIAAFAQVYFVQGIIGLARLAIQYYYKDDLKLDPAEVTFYSGLAAWPWLVKPIYGFISDTFPLFGYKRRSYLVLCGLLGTTSWALLSLSVYPPLMVVGLISIGSLGIAMSDVVIDSMVVQRARDQPQAVAGSLQSLCWAASSTGTVLSAYFSGYLIEVYGVKFVFGLTATFPLLVSASAFLVQDTRVASRPLPSTALSRELRAVGGAAWAQARELWRVVRHPKIYLPATFTFLWQATPSPDSAMFFFYTNELDFQPEFLGKVRLVGALAQLAGIGIYNAYLKKVPPRKMFFGVGVVGCALGMTQLLLVSGANRQLGIPNDVFVLGDTTILTVLGEISFMPVLVLAARICPEGVEATLFATLMSILNSGGVLGSGLGALLTKVMGVTADNFESLFNLVLLCNLLTLLPLAFIRLIPEDLSSEGKDKPKADRV